MRKLVYSFLFLLSTNLIAKLGHVPHEYESQGGYSLGFNNGGTVSMTGLGSIRANPAMLAAEKKYELTGAYMWPASGREVYQLGAVDSTTASVALGLIYTGHREDYTHWSKLTGEKRKEAFHDGSTKRRVAVGAGYTFSNFSFGLGGQFVDGLKENKTQTSGVTLSLGTVFSLTQGLRLGASVENLFNEKVKEFSPRFYRAGASYKLMQMISLGIDYQQRQRVPQERVYSSEAKDTGSYDSLGSGFLSEDEKSVIASGSLAFKEMLLFSVGYGHGLDKTKRRSFAGGVSLSKDSLAVSYSLRRPYLSRPDYNHTLLASYYITL